MLQVHDHVMSFSASVCMPCFPAQAKPNQADSCHCQTKFVCITTPYTYPCLTTDRTPLLARSRSSSVADIHLSFTGDLGF